MKLSSDFTWAFVASVFLYLLLTYSEDAPILVSPGFECLPPAQSLFWDRALDAPYMLNITAYHDCTSGRKEFVRDIIISAEILSNSLP